MQCKKSYNFSHYNYFDLGLDFWIIWLLLYFLRTQYDRQDSW